jgi:predicted aspartyl protease
MRNVRSVQSTHWTIHAVRTCFAVAAIVGTLWVSSDVLAEYYRYEDEQGTLHYVDDLTKVPPRFRHRVTVYEEKYDNLSVEERKRMQERDREELEAFRERQRTEEHARNEQEAKRAKESYLKSLETAIVIQGIQVLVPVALGYAGREVDTMLVLDTGAELTTLYTDLAGRLDIRNARTTSLRVVGGKVIKARLATLEYVRVGPYLVSEVPAVIVAHEGPSSGHDGLLGMNVLAKLNYTVDFDNGVIRWRP